MSVIKHPMLSKHSFLTQKMTLLFMNAPFWFFYPIWSYKKDVWDHHNEFVSCIRVSGI